jgi:hypothetical protein
MSLFWQKEHERLHPTVAIEKAFEPGSTWNRGFFSIGSMLAATDLPQTSEYKTPPLFSRTPHMPLAPSLMMQLCGQSTHLIVPSSFFVQNLASFI